MTLNKAYIVGGRILYSEKVKCAVWPKGIRYIHYKNRNWDYERRDVEGEKIIVIANVYRGLTCSALNIYETNYCFGQLSKPGVTCLPMG